MSLSGYIELYNKGIDVREDEAYSLILNILKNSSSIKEKKIITETYNVLSMSKTPIKLINRSKVLKDISRLEALSDVNRSTFKTKHFLSLNEQFYMIPLLTISEIIVGFILRKVTLPKKSDDNKYDTILRTNFSDNLKEHTKAETPMYGFNSSFESLANSKYSEVIVVCEGLKDCIYLKQFYPYVLSNNGSKLGESMDVLSVITNKIMLVYDNDNTGQPSTIKACY